MSVINIHEARRAGARTVSAFAGVSGSGKTYTALQYAYGLAGYDARKVGLLDTENRRGSLYFACLENATRPTKERFLIGDLAAPFSPSRYTDAMKEFEKVGVEVLVVDSITHSWEGVGGCEDIATAPGADGKEPRMPRWNLAKRENRRMVNYMLQSPMHVVLCVRAREKVKIAANGAVTPLGLQPVSEKNLLFEATLSVMLGDEGRAYSRTKVPADLLPHFPGDKYITADTGYAIRQWVDGGGQVDPNAEKYRNRLLTVCEQGVRSVEAAWAKTPSAIQAALGGESFWSQLHASAAEYDRQREIGEEPETIAAINQTVTAPKGIHLDF
jgi:hypothetical protein